MPDKHWIDDISQWPPVEFGQIYTNLINTPGQFTSEKMKAYKSLEAFNYYIRYAWPYLLKLEKFTCKKNVFLS